MSENRRQDPEWEPRGAALRWLRERMRLTQTEVAERVREAGGQLSEVHYRQLERGRRGSSPSTLALVLEALGSDQLEFQGLLKTQPWEVRSSSSTGTGGWRPRSNSAKPDALYGAIAPESKLLDRSSRLGSGPDSARRLRSAIPAPRSVSSAVPEGLNEELAEVIAEAREVYGIYISASRNDQLTLLNVARNAAAKRR